MDIFERVKKLNFPVGHYVLVGGGAMEARGLRKADDLDIVVSAELFEQLLNEGWEVDVEFQKKWGTRRATKDDVEIYASIYNESLGEFISIPDFIARAEVVNDCPCMRLEELIHYKRDNGRPKDMEDIKLIEEYLRIFA